MITFAKLLGMGMAGVGTLGLFCEATVTLSEGGWRTGELTFELGFIGIGLGLNILASQREILRELRSRNKEK